VFWQNERLVQKKDRLGRTKFEISQRIFLSFEPNRALGGLALPELATVLRDTVASALDHSLFRTAPNSPLRLRSTHWTAIPFEGVKRRSSPAASPATCQREGPARARAAGVRNGSWRDTKEIYAQIIVPMSTCPKNVNGPTLVVELSLAMRGSVELRAC
jgi:hypothetical protein